MTERLSFSVTLTVRSPFIFRGLEGTAFGIDTCHLRDEEGRPIIPANQIRGVLKEALGDLADAGAGVTAGEIVKLFGESSDDKHGEPGRSNDPRRGVIVFSDLTAVDRLQPSEETTRVKIEDETGAVATGMLQVIELVAPFGAEVRFTGEIVVFRPVDDAKRLAGLFGRGLALVASIGAFKSAGFGEVVQERSGIAFTGSKPLALPAAPKGGADFRRLRVRFDRPVLVDGDKIAANAVLGAAIIPGAVIKGALAERLARAGLTPSQGVLGEALAALSVSHAFPESEEAGKPHLVPLPLSLVGGKDGGGTLRFGDALLMDHDGGAMIAGRAAAFTTDWKGEWFGAAGKALGRPTGEEPPGLARTHTAIDSGTGTAEDQKLFTTIARSVMKSDGAPRTWLVDIDLARVPSGEGRELADRMLAAVVADGLDGIGKTSAHADFDIVENAAPPVPCPVWEMEDHFAVMLTTPALMLDLKALVGDDGHWTMDPRAAYAAYWRDVSGDFELVNFFAAQAYRGGHLARRHRLYGANAYFPFLMTEPGSIFLIKTADRGKLAEICRHGLPLPELTGTTAPPSWRNCPYMPENGYGRVIAEHLSTPELLKLTAALDREVPHG